MIGECMEHGWRGAQRVNGVMQWIIDWMEGGWSGWWIIGVAGGWMEWMVDGWWMDGVDVA